MPITSRSLDYTHPQRNGRSRCHISGTDTSGRSYVHGPFQVTPADPTIVDAWLAARAPFDGANRRFSQTQKRKDTAGMAAALADVQQAKIDMQPAYDAFLAASIVEGEAIRDSVVWDTERAEETDIIQWIEDGNDPDTYPREEMTLNEFRRRLAKRMANLPFEGNEKFFCNIASWVLGFTKQQISNVLGITQARAQKILDRASRLDTTICLALALDDGDVQGDV